MTDITVTAPSAGTASGVTTIEPYGRPFAGTPLSTARKGHQAARIDLAVNDLWGSDRQPTGLPVAERNMAIWDWFARRGLDEPSDRHLRRYFNGV